MGDEYDDPDSDDHALEPHEQPTAAAAQRPVRPNSTAKLAAAGYELGVQNAKHYRDLRKEVKRGHDQLHERINESTTILTGAIEAIKGPLDERIEDLEKQEIRDQAVASYREKSEGVRRSYLQPIIVAAIIGLCSFLGGLVVAHFTGNEPGKEVKP